MQPIERILKTLNSFCFKRFKSQFKTKEEFQQYMMTKIVPIYSDLTKSDLGLSQEDRTLITENVHVIMNSAASTRFDDPLLSALNINFYGSLRMLALAKECKHLEVFSHLSTAYSNLNRSGYVDEKIYDT